MRAGLNLCKPVHESVCLSVCLSVSERDWDLLLLEAAALLWLSAAPWGLRRAARNMLGDLSRADVHYRLSAFCRVISSVCDQGKDVWGV